MIYFYRLSYTAVSLAVRIVAPKPQGDSSINPLCESRLLQVAVASQLLLGVIDVLDVLDSGLFVLGMQVLVFELPFTVFVK